MSTALTRRRLLASALAAGVAVPLGATSRAWAAAPAGSGPVRLTLPRPTGRYPVGTVELRLIDKSRPDPVAGPGRFRELMASIWYPARRDAGRRPLTPWLLAAPTKALLSANGFDPDAVTAPLTAGHDGAPVHPGRFPVVVFSHGAHDHRSDTTIVVQELVSHGYVVATVDHTYDAFTQFPNGRLGVPVDDPIMLPPDFARDARFLLDSVEEVAAGRNPDAGHRRLPAGLGQAIDRYRIGMYGWSKGGTATALVMSADPRVRAGLSLDGPMECSPPLSTVIDRPFLMMTADFTREGDVSAANFWALLRGWRLNLQIDGAFESSFCDNQWLIPQLAKAVGMSDADLRDWIGPLDPARAVKIQQAYPLAFFDLHLRGRHSLLLDRPSPAFPEIRFIP